MLARLIDKTHPFQPTASRGRKNAREVGMAAPTTPRSQVGIALCYMWRKTTNRSIYKKQQHVLLQTCALLKAIDAHKCVRVARSRRRIVCRVLEADTIWKAGAVWQRGSVRLQYIKRFAGTTWRACGALPPLNEVPAMQTGRTGSIRTPSSARLVDCASTSYWKIGTAADGWVGATIEPKN